MSYLYLFRATLAPSLVGSALVWESSIIIALMCIQGWVGLATLYCRAVASLR